VIFGVDTALTGADIPVHWNGFFQSLVPSAATLVAVCSVALGISSLVRRANIAAFVILFAFAAVFVLAEVLATGVFENPAVLAIDPFQSAQRIAMDRLSPPPNPFMPAPSAERIPLEWAWIALGAWTGAGLSVLAARIRNVEVVG
jgi:hypothetical protein